MRIPRPPLRRAARFVVLLALLTSCGPLLPVETPTPTPSSSPTASPTLAPTLSPSPTPSPTPTPGPELVPQLPVGSQAITNAPGLRVRSRPGVAQRVITSLGVDARLLIAMGPVFIEGSGWYQVRDADANPAYDEGWVAAGFEPDPFLVSASFDVRRNPYLGGFAGVTDGEFGPVVVGDGRFGMRWMAAALDADGCRFAVDVRSGSGDPQPVLRTEVGFYPAPGEVLPGYFDTHDELHGDLFVTVTSNCSWALSFVRAPRERSGGSG